MGRPGGGGRGREGWERGDTKAWRGVVWLVVVLRAGGGEEGG
jgi:hypothetical protein